MENSGEKIRELGLIQAEDYTGVSIETFIKIAKDFANKLKGGQMVLFFGDLGTGKTTFVRAMMEAFGVEPAVVRSPTFNIVNTYESGDKVFYHIDVYRITADELFDLGFYDYQRSNSIVLVEWAEKIAHEVDQPDYLISLSVNDKNMDTRDIIIYKRGRFD